MKEMEINDLESDRIVVYILYKNKYVHMIQVIVPFIIFKL